MPLNQEDEIKIKHQLMMTTGLDYTGNIDCLEETCLNYLNDPGTVWYYHNAPYTLLGEVISQAAGKSYDGENSVGLGARDELTRKLTHI